MYISCIWVAAGERIFESTRKLRFTYIMVKKITCSTPSENLEGEHLQINPKVKFCSKISNGSFYTLCQAFVECDFKAL